MLKVLFPWRIVDDIFYRATAEDDFAVEAYKCTSTHAHLVVGSSLSCPDLDTFVSTSHLPTAQQAKSLADTWFRANGWYLL